MKAVEKREIEKFRGYLRAKDYVRINKFLVKTSNDFKSVVSQDYMDEITAITDSLKIILHNDINLALANAQSLKYEWINIIELFDEDSKKHIQRSIVSLIVKKSLELFATDVLDHSYFYSVIFVKRIIDFYEKTIDRFKNEFKILSSSYNLFGEFTFHFCLAVKKKLSHLIFEFKVREDEILSGMKLILEFERKYQRIYYSKICCKPQIYKTFYDANVRQFEQLKVAEKLKCMKPSSFLCMVQNNNDSLSQNSKFTGPLSMIKDIIPAKITHLNASPKTNENILEIVSSSHREKNSEILDISCGLNKTTAKIEKIHSPSSFFSQKEDLNSSKVSSLSVSEPNSSSDGNEDFPNTTCYSHLTSSIFPSETVSTSPVDDQIQNTKESNVFCLNFDATSVNSSFLTVSNETAVSVSSAVAEKNPCLASSNIEIDNICEHRKMLSRLFIPYLNSFVIMISKDLIATDFDRNETELNIYTVFLKIFNDISTLFSKVDYFGENSAISLFLRQIDICLTSLIMKIPTRKNFTDSCISLNSILYTEKTFNQLNERIHEKYEINTPILHFLKEIRRVETEEYMYIEEFIRKKISLTTLFSYSKFAYNIFQFVRINIHDNDLFDMDDEVLLFLIEAIISFLFTQILKIKMKPSTAACLLDELMDLKLMLLDFVPRVPLSEVVENYLKIFLIECGDIPQFVRNFEKYSNGMFSFSQILKILENSESNVRLYMEYKKKLNRNMSN